MKWLRVEVDFDSDPEWADNIELRWYILVEGEKKTVVFTDSEMLINVKRGRNHQSVIFVPPRTVDRYNMQSANKVKQIAVQLWHDQKLIDTGSYKNAPTAKDRWWEQHTPVRGAILNLLQTPFAVVEYDQFEQLKVAPSP